MPERVAAINSLAVSATISATRPSGATDGVDTTGWYSGGMAPGRVYVAIDGSVAATLSDPTGGTAGVEIWGYESAQWFIVGILNDGADVPIVGGSQGSAFVVDLGRAYDRLAIAGTPSAGAITSRIVPLDVGR